jgi:hypothetical protein
MATKTNERYVIIRANNAGCFAGILAARKGDCVTLKQSRRLWFWDGAASLSQLAQKGTSKPQNCKFPIAVDLQEIFGVIEILYATETARKSIEGVPVWRH